MTPEELLEECKQIQLKKRADYSSEGTIHENFDRSSFVAKWFKHDVDKVYVVLITTKLARLAVLLSGNKAPNHESIKDSFIDLINYCCLWASKRSLDK